jgi:CubicO group peptidase (beta-lactamase class C family)
VKHWTVFIVAVVVASLASLIVPAGAVPAQSKASDQVAQIEKTVKEAMGSIGLKAVIVEVTKGDKTLIRKAYGESMDDVPATTEMNFRNGAVAFEYLGTLLMVLVDEHKVSLDDTIDKWFPELPAADKVTVKMLANQTSGYPDYEQNPTFRDAFGGPAGDPFHIFTFQERLDIAFSVPLHFEPGTNWSYAHTNFMILGEILAKVGKQPLDVLLKKKVLDPLGLHHTQETITSEIPSPLLHTYSSERTGLYEEATFWNTQWGTPIGANETTTVDDLITSAQGVGEGKLLSKKSYHEMIDAKLLGFGQEQANCTPECFTQTKYYNFGLGVVRQGGWIAQTPLLSGIAASNAYNRKKRIAIAVVITLTPQAFIDNDGGYPPNPSKTLFAAIGKIMAPDDAPPVRTG